MNNFQNIILHLIMLTKTTIFLHFEMCYTFEEISWSSSFCSENDYVGGLVFLPRGSELLVQM